MLVISSKWMLHTVVVEERPPHMIVKRFGCIAMHNKALYKCIIHNMHANKQVVTGNNE